MAEQFDLYKKERLLVLHLDFESSSDLHAFEVALVIAEMQFYILL